MKKSPLLKSISSKPFKIENGSFHQESLKQTEYFDTAFIKCSFSETPFYNTHFTDCLFQDCQFKLNKWEGARIQNCLFMDSKMVGADLFKCDPFLFSCTFKNCHIILANFSDLPMNEVMFENCRLSECYFNNTKLKKAKFPGSNLSLSRFHGCDLTEADFSTASEYFIDPLTNRIKKAKFSFPEVIGLLKGFEIDLV